MNYVHDPDNGGNWSDDTRWVPNIGYPNEAGDVATIHGGSGPRTITLDLSPDILGIDFRGGWNLVRDAVDLRTVTLRADPDTPASSPYFYIGSHEAGTNRSNGTVVLDEGVAISLEGGRFLVGTPQVNGRAGNGHLTVRDGAALHIGTAANRSQWDLGRHSSSRHEEASSSVIADAGSTVSAWLTGLRVGNNDGSSDQAGDRQITGVLDLSAATVTAFDVSGDMVIGSGASHVRGSDGKVLLPEVDGRIGGNVLIGDSVLTSGEIFGSAGLLDLDGTHLEVGGNVTIDLTGRVKVTLGEGAGGLRLSAGSGLTISAFGAGAGDEDAGYFIDFTNATFSGGELLYGFAWEGDQLDDLTALVDSHAITWSAGPDGLTAGLFYDAGADLTYIGFAPIPEPGTVSLLAGGAVLLGWLGRRRLKKSVG